MKTPILLMAVLLILLLSACDRPLFGPNLPRETQEGANTFGCRVDGEVWLPNNPVFPYISTSSSFGDGTMFVDADDRKGETSISIHFYKKIFSDSTYSLFHNGADKWVYYYANNTFYYPDSQQAGYLMITRLDTLELGIVSGTFSFDAVNENDSTDVIHITDGRFDLKF
ncbi:MAG: DUF6252 family protein [Bacteroidia bacterium]|nr:DUF6252 family protein [Bacteroidia bacterium]